MKFDMTDFEEYIRQSEPHKREKGYAWQTAIGLQAVDGLKTSDYLRETARQHIEGDITIEEVKQLVNSYYESKSARKGGGNRTEEADKVSARITELLSEQSFTFSPLEYISIHRRLFEGIYEHAGKIRDYNITKKEWVLNGETVLYVSAESQSAAENAPKCNSCTLEELALLNFIREKPNATQKEIVAQIGKSERTVKNMTVKWSKQGIIERKNGRRNGYWDSENNEMNN